MNVTFSGYLALMCDGCKTKCNIECGELQFEQDLSPEAEEDNYIRYIVQIDTHCASCSSKLQLNLDVWEHPESVANYSYYGVRGAHDIECEFNIEHYFDDEASEEGVALSDETSDQEIEKEGEGDVEGENETVFDDDEKKFNDASASERYVDHYDDDN